jgi:hypothetical protein
MVEHTYQPWPSLHLVCRRDLERATGCVSAGVGVGIALMGVVVPAVLLGHGEAD